MKFLIYLVIGVFLMTACLPVATESLPTANLDLPTTEFQASTNTPTVKPSTTPSQTETPLPTETLTPTFTPTVTETPTLTPVPTFTETVSEMLRSHIVFFLIIPEKGHTDACGDISLEPIISKRYRTGDKVQDVQIALNMMFNTGARYYGIYYNALWDTDLYINSYTYDEKKDSMVIDFGGFFPIMELSKCDKHGIREQIWKTFFYYGIKDKIFTYNGKFLIDQLGR